MDIGKECMGRNRRGGEGTEEEIDWERRRKGRLGWEEQKVDQIEEDRGLGERLGERWEEE